MNFQKILENLAVWAITTLLAGVIWLTRLVFTNQKQIALLQQSIERDRADVKELKADVKELLQRTDQ